LCETAKEFVRIYNQFTGENLRESDLTEYDTSKVVPDKYKWFANHIWEMPELYEHAIPLNVSQMHTKMLANNNDIELYVASVSPPEVISCKYKFLAKEYPWIKQENIIIINNKKLLNMDVLVDDNPQNLINGKYHKILLNYYWNKSFDCKSSMVRANDWYEIYDEIMRMLQTYKNVAELSE
jgi:5'(3')-deoxyribonucleotidase